MRLKEGLLRERSLKSHQRSCKLHEGQTAIVVSIQFRDARRYPRTIMSARHQRLGKLIGFFCHRFEQFAVGDMPRSIRVAQVEQLDIEEVVLCMW
jgi:hypothetical protein